MQVTLYGDRPLLERILSASISKLFIFRGVIMRAVHTSIASQVYSYSRFSKLRQRDGDSLRRQREFAEKIAEEHGLTINEELVFSDHGKSAFHAEHKSKGNYGAFLKAVEDGKVVKGSILIVESFDRLSRENALSAQSDIAALIEKDIIIITSIDGNVYSKEVLNRDPSLLFLMIAAMIRANEESLTKQKRSLQRIQGAVKKWKSGDKTVKLGGSTPTWIKRKKDGWVFDEEKANTVKQMCDMYINGKSMGDIVAYLNDNNTPTFGKSTSWAVTTVTTIFDNIGLFGRKVIALGASNDGVIKPFKATVDNYFPALITEEEFALIQEIKKLKSNGRAGHRTTRKIIDDKGNCLKEVDENAVYLLTGYGRAKDGDAKSRCYACGGGLGSRRQNQHTRKGEYLKTEYRIQCASSGSTRHDKCDAGSIKMGNMEKTFLMAVSDHIDFNLLNKNVDSREVEVIESKLKEVELKIEKATLLFVSSTNDTIQKSAQEMLNELTKEQEGLERKRADGKEIIIRQDAIDRFTSIVDRAAFNMEDHEARKEVKNILVQSVAKLVMHMKKKQTMADFGFPNIMPGVLVYGIEIHFKSEKVMWCFHDVKRDVSAFTAFVNSGEDIDGYTWAELEKWDELGDDAFEEYIAHENAEKAADIIGDWLESFDEDGNCTSADDPFNHEKTKAEEIQGEWFNWEASTRESAELGSKEVKPDPFKTNPPTVDWSGVELGKPIQKK